jgi:hypothetical protein
MGMLGFHSREESRDSQARYQIAVGTVGTMDRGRRLSSEWDKVQVQTWALEVGQYRVVEVVDRTVAMHLEEEESIPP